MRVGLCGLGSMGSHHAGLLKQHKDVEFVCAADTVKEKRDNAEKQYGVRTYSTARSMLLHEKLDAVLICIPTYLHRETTLQALDAGCHVFCEKPMGLQPEECREMTRAAKAAGKILMIGQVLRFWPEYIFLKEAIDSGKYGKLRTLTMSRVGVVSTGWKNWFLDEKRGGMQIFDRHIHDADAVLWLVGKPKSIRSFGYEKPASQGGICHCFTHYEFGESPLVCVEGSADMPKNYPFRAAYRAVFDQACIEYCGVGDNKLTVYTGDKLVHPVLPKRMELRGGTLNLSEAGPYMVEQCYFFDCVRNGTNPEQVTPEGAMESVRLVRAEIKSVRTGKAVPFRSVRKNEASIP